jgi:hypothetical protein
LRPTDIRSPDHFHKVVDCQWACPAHTPVPEYIRLIAAGRHADAIWEREACQLNRVGNPRLTVGTVEKGVLSLGQLIQGEVVGHLRIDVE